MAGIDGIRGLDVLRFALLAGQQLLVKQIIVGRILARTPFLGQGWHCQILFGLLLQRLIFQRASEQTRKQTNKCRLAPEEPQKNERERERER